MSNVEALMPDGNPRYVRVYDLGDNVPSGRMDLRYTVVFTGNYAKPDGCNYWLEMGLTVVKLCRGSGIGIDRT